MGDEQPPELRDVQEEEEEEEELAGENIIGHESRSNTIPRTGTKSGRSEENKQDDEETNLRLEDKISYHHLQQLEQIYDTLEVDDPDEPPSLDQENFIKTISEVIGTARYNEDLAKLFSKLDNSGDGNVDFNELLTYLLMQLRENDFMRQRKDFLFTSMPRIKHLVQNHLIASICLLTSENPLRYYSLSKEGILCVIDGNLQVEQWTDINSANVDDERKTAPSGGAPKMARRYRSWMCDAVYMANVKKIAVAGHQLFLIDCSAPACYVETIVHGLPCAPFALDYWFSPASSLSSPHGRAMLFIGGDNGTIYTLNFHKPNQELFSHVFSTSSGTAADKKINFADLFDGPHTGHCTVTTTPNVHNDTISRIRYCPERDLIFSCSRSSTNSLVIRDRNEKKQSYIFKAPKGVSCFDYDLEMELVVTGSSDYVVRLWNMYVTQRPIAMLEGHGSPITDLLLYVNGGALLSYAEEERVVKVWDVVDHLLLESMTVPFPAESARKGGDIPSRAMILRARNEDCKLLLSKGDYLAFFTLGARARNLSNEKPTTHTWPLTYAVFNDKANHVAFAGKDSTVLVYELDTGAKVIALSSVHEKEEVTCMAFDYTYKRLVTGARNGEIKIWAYQTGQLLTTLAPIGESEVTGIIPMADLRKIVTGGWDRKITIYDDYDIDATYVEGDTKWQGGQLHEDDISALELCPPTWIATGGCDGQIFVWNYQTQRLFLKLRPVNMTTGKLMSTVGTTGTKTDAVKQQPARSATARSQTSAEDSRPGTKTPTGGQDSSNNQIQLASPVEKLLFLKERYKRSKDSAVLISSEDGNLYWWSLWTQQHLFRVFTAVSYLEDYIIAMQSDPEDKLLVCGDTDGYINIWNIAEYALEPTGEVVTNVAPPKVNTWKAHDKAISSLCVIVGRSSKLFVMTSSYDRNVRLWSIDGQLVGTFGCGDPWDLRDKSTWQVQTESSPRHSSLSEIRMAIASGSNAESASGKRSSKVNFRLSTDDGENNTFSRQRTNTTSSRRGTVSGQHNAAIAKQETNLGTKVVTSLERIKKDRESRRQFMEDIEREKMKKYGSGASAFQALVVTEVGDTELPQGLPLLPGMKQRGITNMTEETLRRLNFTKTTYVASMFDII